MAKKQTAKQVAANERRRLKLSPIQERFVLEYLIDLNATAAYRRAGYKPRDDRAASGSASELLALPKVAAAVAALREKLKDKLEITAEKVVERWWSIAEADPNELIEFRRTCCRYCYGRRNALQRTQGEMDRDRAAWKVKLAKDAKDGIEPEPFNELGGIGYDKRRPPSPECMECFGDGIGEAFAKDTRTLSESARLLYAGVKETKDGLEMKLQDQAAARVNVAKHLGLFVSKQPPPPGSSPENPLHTKNEHSISPEALKAFAADVVAAGLGDLQAHGGAKPVDSGRAPS